MIGLSTGTFYERTTRQIGGLRGQAERLQQQIGSGERLSRSSDDPVAAARLRSLLRRESLSETAQRNSDSARMDLQLADDALSSTVSIILRARELATRAANGALGEEQRAAIGLEFASLRDGLLIVANSRNGAGYALFGGQSASAAYEVSGGSVVYIGTAAADAVDLGEEQVVIPTLSGPEIFSFNVDGTANDLFAVLGTLATALQDGHPDAASAARDALTTLDAGLDKVTTAQTTVGARLGWIDLMDQRREVTGELAAEERAAIGGADLATTMTRLQEVLTVLEASQASFLRVASLSLFDMMR